MSYNGWTNYETWNVKLWLDNDGWQYEKGMPTKPFELADYLKDMIKELTPDLGATMFADLLGAALSSVDWDEIARAILEDNEVESESEEA